MNVIKEIFRSRRNAFTLIEAMIAVLLVGLAVVALLTSSGSFTKVNAASVSSSTAEFLIEQIRELTTSLAVRDPQTGSTHFGPEESLLANYDDVDDFDGATYCPPIGSDRTQLTKFAAFSQQITVQNVNSANFEQVVAHHSSPFVKITVRILYNGSEIAESSWIRANL